MVQQHQKCSHRGTLLLFCLLPLLLSRSFVAAGSISPSHKNSAPQQQANAAQQQQQQRQDHITPQHLQQQQPATEFQNTNSHLRPHEQQQQQQQQHLLSALPPHLSAITTSDSSNNGVNHEYHLKDVDADEELNDPFQYLSDLKAEPRLTTGNSLPWNPYMTTNQPFSPMSAMLNNLPFIPYGSGSALPPMVTPRLMPFVSYPQPVFIPLPMYFAPSDLYYPSYSDIGGNEIDEPMPRAAHDHRAQPSSHFQQASTANAPGTPIGRNSQIYFMRFAPMPYMFMPGLGFTAPQTTLPAMQPFSMPAISPILNIPLNFVANGKPTNIYQMGGTPNDFQSSVQFNNVNPFGLRAPTSAFASAGAHRPTASNLASSYSTHGPYGISTSPQSLQQDSKMTLLKRPFLFNGRPEEIYTLPNNFNPLYTNGAYF